MTILDFPLRKKNNQKISMLTCYDATFAAILGSTSLDCLLVGDSCAMVVYGEQTTLPATLSMMVRHTAAVRRAAGDTFITADMPFLSYRQGRSRAARAAGELLRAGANAVKLEGLTGNELVIEHLVHSGIPVMGHLGLTPQFYHSLGGWRVQGRDQASAEALMEQAQRLQLSGCFALVLECVPEALAAAITSALDIPVIGIGAGRAVDGQVLVLHDLLGFTSLKTSYARQYLDGAALVSSAVENYCRDVADVSFPSEREVFVS